MRNDNKATATKRPNNSTEVVIQPLRKTPNNQSSELKKKKPLRRSITASNYNNNVLEISTETLTACSDGSNSENTLQTTPSINKYVKAKPQGRQMKSKKKAHTLGEAGAKREHCCAAERGIKMLNDPCFI